MGKGKKRKLQHDPYQETYYDNVSVVAREPTGRPGTPHSFFQSSFDVVVSVSNSDQYTKTCKQEDATKERTATRIHNKLTVHRHANGLCIVTLGENISSDIVSVKYLVQPGSECSNAERRKRLSKVSKGNGNVSGAVTPSTPIMELTDAAGTVISVLAGLWGLLIEINLNMSVELLERDSILDGYIAIILPTNAFPPTPRECLANSEPEIEDQLDVDKATECKDVVCN